MQPGEKQELANPLDIFHKNKEKTSSFIGQNDHHNIYRELPHISLARSKCKSFVSKPVKQAKNLRDNAVKNRIRKMLFGTKKKSHHNICTIVIDRTASSGNHQRVE
jgi:hypothetical protein